LSSQKGENGSGAITDDDKQSSVRKIMSVDSPSAKKNLGVEVDLPSFESEIAALDQGDELFVTATTGDDGNVTVSNEIFSGQSWLSQFNAQSIAIKLSSLGVDGASAKEAGENIQEYVLGRVARRRIRKFLKERDAIWESRSTVATDNRAGMRESMTLAVANNFDVDSVISILCEFGLTGNDIAAVFSHTPSVAMMRTRQITEHISDESVSKKVYVLEDTLERALLGLLGETLKLRRYDARKVLRTCPGLLTPKGSASAEQVVKILVSLGSSTSSIARDKASLPSLLSRSPALLFRLVAFLSSAQLQVPLNAIGPILRRKQSVEMLNAVAPMKSLQTTPFSAMDGIVNGEKENAGIDMDILGYLPTDETTRGEQIEENYRSMKSVGDVLRQNFGVRDFRKILSSYPGAFFLNVAHVESIATYLREDVGMRKSDIRKAVQTFPSLLALDLSQIKNVVDYLLSLEVDEEELSIILRAFPSTLSLDIEVTIDPVVRFLRQSGVRNVGRFVTRLPPVLGYSVEEDLKPKWDFLREVCKFEYFEIVRFPAYFSYPLERVIKMRYIYLRDIKQIPIWLTRIDDVLRFGDRDFATEIALDDDNGKEFAKFVRERSCSSLQEPKRRRQKQLPRGHLQAR